jgi:hypothetical protein
MTKSLQLIVMVLVALPLLGALALLGAAPQAVAQAATPSPQLSPRPWRYVRRPIEIHPRPLLYRRCVDWYELQNRPSGTVLYPQMRCWWVRG